MLTHLSITLSLSTFAAIVHLTAGLEINETDVNAELAVCYNHDLLGMEAVFKE